MVVHVRCEKNSVKVICNNKYKNVTTFDEFVNSLAEICNKYKIAAEDLIVMCSSSIDFPEEYTEDQNIIDLCYLIRE